MIDVTWGKYPASCVKFVARMKNTWTAPIDAAYGVNIGRMFFGVVIGGPVTKSSLESDTKGANNEDT